MFPRRGRPASSKKYKYFQHEPAIYFIPSEELTFPQSLNHCESERRERASSVPVRGKKAAYCLGALSGGVGCATGAAAGAGAGAAAGALCVDGGWFV